MHDGDRFLIGHDVNRDLAAMLGWQDQVNLDEGMKRMVDWYLAERSWASQVVTA